MFVLKIVVVAVVVAKAAKMANVDAVNLHLQFTEINLKK
jgi:hypothetical protein